MVPSAFWLDPVNGEHEECSSELVIRDCTSDSMWPIEISGKNTLEDDIGLSLNVVDSIRLYYCLHKRFGESFTN